MSDPGGNEKRKGGGRILRFFLRFLAFSVVLYALYLLAGKYYVLGMGWTAKGIMAVFGYSIDLERLPSIVEELALNPVVYLSLVLAVTGAGWRERVRPAILGVVILTAFDILVICLVYLSFITGNETLSEGTEFLYITINFFITILLWFVLSPKGDLIPPAAGSRA